MNFIKNMKIWHSILVVASIIPVTAYAAGFSEDLSGNMGLTTDYVFRGITQSDEQPALQAGLDYKHDSGFYVSAWGSSVDFNDGDEASFELDIYGGYGGEFSNGIGYDLGILYYAYPGADSDLNYDFVEIYAGLSHDWDIFSAGIQINYSPDYFGGSGDAYYGAFNVDIPLPKDFSLITHAGYQFIDDETSFGTPDYLDWSAGFSYSLHGFDLGLTYFDTDLDTNDCADGCSERIVFSVTKNF